jgi:hypothetical protein
VNPFIGERERSVDVYKPGYNVTSASNESAGKYVLERRQGLPEEQFDQIRGPNLQGCDLSAHKSCRYLRQNLAETAIPSHNESTSQDCDRDALDHRAN